MISAATVKELRERTGAGMMDCKRALEGCGGDMDKAIEFLREKGLATAAKKAGRVAKQGLVFGKQADQRAAMVELNCETDFVAKNEEFQRLGSALADLALAQGIDQVEQLLALPYEGSNVQAALTDRIATLGENMGIRRLAFYETASGLLDLYLHGGGRIAVLVQLELGEAAAAAKPELQELAHDLALQIVAAKAQYIAQSDVPAEVVAAEQQIYHAQAVNEGRPENVIPRMVEGRLRKFYEENCLLEQFYVKDTDIKVGALIERLAKQTGTSITVSRFARFEVGEGASAEE